MDKGPRFYEWPVFVPAFALAYAVTKTLVVSVYYEERRRRGDSRAEALSYAVRQS